MNFYLIELLGKWVCFLAVSISSFLGFSSINEYEINDNNNNVSVLTEVIPYETEIIYNNSVPNTVKRTVKEGSDGLKFTNSDGTEVILQDVVNEVVEVGTGAVGLYNGIMDLIVIHVTV